MHNDESSRKADLSSGSPVSRSLIGFLRARRNFCVAPRLGRKSCLLRFIRSLGQSASVISIASIVTEREAPRKLEKSSSLCNNSTAHNSISRFYQNGAFGQLATHICFLGFPSRCTDIIARRDGLTPVSQVAKTQRSLHFCLNALTSASDSDCTTGDEIRGSLAQQGAPSKQNLN